MLKSFCGPKAFDLAIVIGCPELFLEVIALGLLLLLTLWLDGDWWYFSLEHVVWLVVDVYTPQSSLMPPAYVFRIPLSPEKRLGHRALLHAVVCHIL